MGKRGNSLGTVYALKLIEQGHTPYSAAKLAGVALSTIYRALKRQREKAK
jgi:transposase